MVVRKKIDAVGRESARLGATEGALSVVQDLAIGLRGHVVASANRGAMSKDELAAHQQSVDSILETIDFLSQATTHEGSQMTEMDHQHSLLAKEREGLAGARSKIEGTDVASEAAAPARARALQEVATYTASLTSRMEAGQVLTLLAGVATP